MAARYGGETSVIAMRGVQAQCHAKRARRRCLIGRCGHRRAASICLICGRRPAWRTWLTAADLQPTAAPIDGADVIIVVTGGNAQAVVARSLAPVLRNGQVILLIQGNTGGSLIVRRALDDAGCRCTMSSAHDATPIPTGC
jgi:hypothetical protein